MVNRLRAGYIDYCISLHFVVEVSDVNDELKLGGTSL